MLYKVITPQKKLVSCCGLYWEVVCNFSMDKAFRGYFK